MANLVPDFTVIERETKVLGCALLLPLGLDEHGVCVAEVGGTGEEGAVGWTHHQCGGLV